MNLPLTLVLILATLPLATAWPFATNTNATLPGAANADDNSTCHPECVYLPDPLWCSNKCGQDWVRGSYHHQWCGWLSFQCCC